MFNALLLADVELPCSIEINTIVQSAVRTVLTHTWLFSWVQNTEIKLHSTDGL